MVLPVKSVAIIGCGSIGGILAKSIDRGEAGKTELGALFDLERAQAEELANELSASPPVVDEIEDVLEDDSIDLVVEAASQKAVLDFSKDILSSGKDLVVLSVGAFSNEEFFDNIQDVTEKSGKRVYIPSGAILGLDGIQAAEIGGFEEVTLTTRKPPETLSKTKFVMEKNIDLSGLSDSKLIFEGSASRAVEEFPESVNVAASLSLAGEGFQKTIVRIIADPSLDQNVHEIKVRGKAGEFSTSAHNFPSSENPKTSYLAALSVIRTLRNLTCSVSIGA